MRLTAGSSLSAAFFETNIGTGTQAGAIVQGCSVPELSSAPFSKNLWLQCHYMCDTYLRDQAFFIHPERSCVTLGFFHKDQK